MKYGHFDDQRREYVIERPDTPLPWINYLGAEDFIGIISNTAGGYTFYRDARLRRLTRYRYNNVPVDENGRYLYIRDDDTGDFWSPSWQPARVPLDAYSCRHGLGYTVIEGRKSDIHARTTYFVPEGQTLEVWSLELVNHRQTPASLSLFAGVEFCLWNALDDATNFQRNLNIAELAVEDRMIAHHTEYRERRNHYAAFTASEPMAGFDTQRDAFLGPYRSWDRPIVLERGDASNSLQVGGVPIGMQHLQLHLAAGETRRLLFTLSYHESDDANAGSGSVPDLVHAMRAVEPFLIPETVDRAFDELRATWEEKLAALQIDTSEPLLDRMINTWNAYQCAITYSVSRSASRYESGIGRGIGFRDANQDLLGCVHLIPGKARARILDLASTQLTSGGAYHQYQPLTKAGNHDIGSGFNDDPLWLIASTAAYLKETADWSILDEACAYGDDASLHEPLYRHLCRAADYTLERLGPHGLPLIGRADWNDCLNLNSHSADPDESFQTVPIREDGVAESVFIAALFCWAGADLAEIAQRRSDAATHDRLRSAIEGMQTSVLNHGWDGDWFLRAYDAGGRKVGSRECQEGRIFIEPQGFCPMAGIGIADGKAESALNAVRERLLTDHGALLHQPAYTQYQLGLGEISSYPPGYKENGSTFCHTNPWVAIAECLIGRGDRAWDVMKRINPAAREAISEVHECEPYVYAQTIVGRDAADHGRARNSWLTGTASWTYVAVSQWILGIRPDYDGLRVDPCIPAHIRTFHVQRRFRGATYSIAVENANGVCRGVRTIHVDGRPIDGTTLPVFDDAATHEVRVSLGD